MPAQKPSNWNPTPQLWREIRLFLSQLPFQKKKGPILLFLLKVLELFLITYCNKKQKKGQGRDWKVDVGGSFFGAFVFQKKTVENIHMLNWEM